MRMLKEATSDAGAALLRAETLSPAIRAAATGGLVIRSRASRGSSPVGIKIVNFLSHDIVLKTLNSVSFRID